VNPINNAATNSTRRYKHCGDDRPDLDFGESKQCKIRGKVNADESVAKATQSASEDQSFGVRSSAFRKKHSELKHTEN
jgi:hypothetical protein